MKIGYLMNTYPMSSTTFVRREIQALERLGHHIHRFAIRPHAVALVDPADIAEAARTEHVLSLGLRLLPSAMGWMLRHLWGSLRALHLAMRCGARGAAGVPGTGGRLRHLIYLIEAAHIAARCEALRLTHLHAHFGTNAATVAMLAREMGGPPFSFTAHGPEEYDAPITLSLGLKLERAAFAAAISSFGRSQLCRWVSPEHWARIAVVHCGIEPWRFPTPAPTQIKGLHLVAIGRLSEQKGFALLIEAVALAAPDLPDLQVTIIGDGPLRASLQSRITAAGLDGRITLAGWKDEAGVRAALAAASALVLPSFAEGLPVVLMEAMAAGRPVIATAIAGIPELVTPDVGWLVPAGDPHALARAIATLAAVPANHLTQMGISARARVLARHDIDTEAVRLSALFSGKTP